MAAPASKPYLSSGYIALALRLQESAGDLSASDAREKLLKAIMDAAITPLSEVGRRNNAGDQQVIQTIHDHALALGACCDAGEEMMERYISDKAREDMSDSDFAGKDKSFPIKSQEDVDAAFHSIGRAGADNYSSDKIRENIIRIAKRKGFTLPKSAQESVAVGGEGMKLTESASTIEPIVLKESRSDYEIKLISPGKGSSAFYPAEVLRRDGPEVFTAGTHVYLNHPTAAEEAQRPEGDVANLAGVLTTGAVYHESHPKGEGLYARMKVFADHGALVEEKAAHVGMSIRASGIAEAGGKMRDGVPVLKKLTAATSVDVVTRAGAGGMILTEAAKPQNSQEVSMTEAEVTKLVEAAVLKAVETTVEKTAGTVRSLTERAIRGDAREEGARLLESVSLPPISKARVIEAVLRDLPIKDGALDTVRFGEIVTAESKREGAYVGSLTGGNRVTGLGASSANIVDPKEAEASRQAQEQAAERSLKESAATFMRLGMTPQAALLAARGRAS